MQASASLETKLPQALIRQSAALKEKYGGLVNSTTEPETSDVTEVQTPVTDAPAEPPVATSTVPRENDIEYWKHRVSVMTGILRTERDDRKAQVAMLNQRVNELVMELQTARDAAPEVEGDLGEFFSPEQIEDMGESAARATYNAIKKQIKSQLKAELKPIQDSQAARQADEQAERVTAFTDRLAELIPTYIDIDASDEWRVWLAEENADGIKRQSILDRHAGALNAERTAAMFKEFQATQIRPAPPISPNGTGATAPSVPQKGGHSTPPTSAEIKDFYKRSALGKVSPQEVVRFEERMALLTQ